ncbi:MAG: trypsin-like peptidase domain-containing protein [Bernardetiaceae bacterium]
MRIQGLITALLEAILGSGLTYFLMLQHLPVFISEPTHPPVQQAFAPTSRPDFALAAAKAKPSVVYIKTYSDRYRSTSWADYFFGEGSRSSRDPIGTGSGVIISKDGYIITNNHVIHRAQEIEVVLNKRSYPAKVIGTDPSSDLALLKIDKQGLTPITFGSSSDLQVGQWVVAVGNPFNLTSTVTAGIVSAKGRSIDIMGGQFPLEAFIQTDAAINPGNSGGALVNADGELVGINTAILSETGSYVGYGFAVPSDIVRKIMTDLREYGQVQKAFLGASVLEVNEGIAKRFGLSEVDGVVLAEIENGGAAQQAQLKAGDIIRSINGTAIHSRSDFDEQMSFFRPGDQVRLRIERQGKTFEPTLRLTNINGTTDLVQREVYQSQSLGAILEAVPLLERSRLKISGGVRIKSIGNGFLRRLGIREGFVVTAINDYAIETPEAFVQIMERIRGRVIIKGLTPEGERGYYSFYF